MKKRTMSEVAAEHAPQWRTAMMVLATFAAIGALYATYSQLATSNRGVQAQVAQTINQQLTEINRTFVDKPNLWKYFYQGTRIRPSDADYPAVMAVADMHLDFFEMFDEDYIRELPGMGKEGTNWKLWQNYFKDIFRTAPALCLRLSETKNWYSTTTIGALWTTHCEKSGHWKG